MGFYNRQITVLHMDTLAKKWENFSEDKIQKFVKVWKERVDELSNQENRNIYEWEDAIQSWHCFCAIKTIQKMKGIKDAT